MSLNKMISPSGVYVIVLTFPDGENCLVTYKTPAFIEPNTAAISNSFMSEYLTKGTDDVGMFVALFPIEKLKHLATWEDFQQELKVTQAQKAGMNVGYHAPEDLLKATAYSIDVSLYYELQEGRAEDIPITAFNPTNPDINFRQTELQCMNEESPQDYYLDLIWCLNASSPAEALKYVERHINEIPVPKGLKLLNSVAGDEGVYDNKRGSWVDPSNPDD